MYSMSNISNPIDRMMIFVIGGEEIYVFIYKKIEPAIGKMFLNPYYI